VFQVARRLECQRVGSRAIAAGRDLDGWLSVENYKDFIVADRIWPLALPLLCY